MAIAEAVGLTDGDAVVEAATTDSALERRKHSLWVVVRPVDVQRLAIPAERDRAPAIPRSQGPPRPPEVGVRLEAEAPCVVDGAEYEMPGELERDRDSLRLPPSEVLALEGVELALAHPLWPDRVLDPQTPCVDEVAAHGQLVAPVRRRDEHAGDARAASQG